MTRTRHFDGTASTRNSSPVTRAARRLAIAPEFEWVRVALIAPALLFPIVAPPVTAGALAVWVTVTLAALTHGHRLIPATPLLWPAGALGLMVAVAWWASSAPDLALPKAAGVLLGLLVVRALLMVATTRRRTAIAAAVYLATGVAWVTGGALAAAWLAKFPWLGALTSHFPQILGTLPGMAAEGVHPNALGGTVLGLLVPVLVFLWIGHRGTEDVLEPVVPSQRRRGVRAVLIGVTGYLMVLLALSQSRTAWLSAGLTLVVVGGIHSRRFRRIVGASLIVSTAVAWMFWPAVANQGRTLAGDFGANIHPTDVTLDVRMALWRSALLALQDAPLMGMGLSVFRRVVHDVYPVQQLSAEFDVAHAHNVFLQTALDTGLIGLAAYGALLLVVFWMTAHTVRRAADFDGVLVLSLASGLGAALLFGMADALVLGSKVGLFFWMSVGIVAAVHARTAEVRSPAAPSPTAPCSPRRTRWAKHGVGAGAGVSVLGLLFLGMWNGACGNVAAIQLLQAYAGRAPRGTSSACTAGLAPVRDALIETNVDPESTIASALDAGEPIRRLRLDQLLTFASRLTDDSQRARLLELAEHHSHDSPLGYLAIARQGRRRVEAGQMDLWSPTQAAYRLAARTTTSGYRSRVARAEAWFNVGQFAFSAQPDEALAAYAAALAEDPEDESGGYAWMSLMQAVEIHASRKDWDAAYTLLSRAARLPDLYHRRSHTALRAARLDLLRGHTDTAVSRLETATAQEPDFVPSQLEVAKLYRMQKRERDAVERYRHVLAVDPDNLEARQALAGFTR